MDTNFDLTRIYLKWTEKNYQHETFENVIKKGYNEIKRYNTGTSIMKTIKTVLSAFYDAMAS